LSKPEPYIGCSALEEGRGGGRGGGEEGGEEEKGEEEEGGGEEEGKPRNTSVVNACVCLRFEPLPAEERPKSYSQCLQTDAENIWAMQRNLSCQTNSMERSLSFFS